MSYGQYSTGHAERTNPLRNKLATATKESKPKRVKQVYSDISEIAHLWAHRAQSSARNPQGNFYFDGDTIYSYGSHFAIARIVTVSKGPNKGSEVVYLTTDSYSVTTAKHIGVVRSSVKVWNPEANPHMVTYHKGTDREYSYESKGAWLEAGRRIFNTPEVRTDDLTSDWSKRIESAIEDIIDVPKGTRQSTKAKKFDALITLICQANDWASYCGERKRWKVPADIAEASKGLSAEREKQRKAEEKWRADAERKKQAIEAQIRDRSGAKGGKRAHTHTVSVIVTDEVLKAITQHIGKDLV